MLDVEQLWKSYGGAKGRKAGSGVKAVNGIDLHVEEGNFFTLLGPSGCGKTTTLRSVAGLEEPDSGRISVAGRVLFDSQRRIRVPSWRRGLGMVFQSYAIWPHMNVYNNVAFPLAVLPRSRRPSRRQIAERVERSLSVVQLDGLGSRAATDLSGGQQQRLALARALVIEPPLLLLDEPLSNLDAKLRETMRFELRRLQTQLGITFVYVTHDQTEALAMSSLIAIMNGGVVEQIGTPGEVYGKPVSRFVADFVGTSNFIKGTARAGAHGYRIETPHGSIDVPSEMAIGDGDAVTVVIRPEFVAPVDATAAGASEGWRGEVVGREFLGGIAEHRIRVGDQILIARDRGDGGLEAGAAVCLRFQTSAGTPILRD